MDVDIRGSVTELLTPHIKLTGLYVSGMKLVIMELAVELTVGEMAVSELGMGGER